MSKLILAQVSQLVPAPILGACVWGTLTFSIWSFWRALQSGIAQLKKIHQIPCSQCLYFTGDYHLKCTVNPCTALTEDAIECRDFEPVIHRVPICSRCSKLS